MPELNDDQYQVLFAFRCALRQYLQWSASHAAKLGLAPQQAQLLLAIRVRPADAPPSISDLATALQIRQHSAVGLANRAQRAGLVSRTSDRHDQRVVRIGLTERGRAVIAQLAESHLAELQMVAATLQLSDQFLENLSHQFAGLLPSVDDTGVNGAQAGAGSDDGTSPQADGRGRWDAAGHSGAPESLGAAGPWSGDAGAGAALRSTTVIAPPPAPGVEADPPPRSAGRRGKSRGGQHRAVGRRRSAR